MLDVSRGLPGARMRDDGAVDALDVVALADRPLPPEVLQVVLQLHAEGTVVPEAVDASVDLTRLEDEAAPGAQGDELLHGDRGSAVRLGFG